MLKEIFKGLFWTIVGVAFALLLERPIHTYLDTRAKAKEIPHQRLSEADQDRRQFTQISLNSASMKFSSLTDNKDPAISAEAYRGLSRTFSDWSTLRYRLGLPAGSYPDRALANAFQAQREAPKTAETQIALAYALESLELREVQKTTTRTKLLDNLSGSDTDVQYLRWLARVDSEAKTYPDTLDPETVTNLRVLVDVRRWKLPDDSGSGRSQPEQRERSEACCRILQSRILAEPK